MLKSIYYIAAILPNAFISYYGGHMNVLSLVLFGLTWAVILYGLNCLIARRLKTVEPQMALVYFLGVALIGLFGEIFLDTVYNAVVGHPLWKYNILPIHNAYTSSYAVVVWGLYGFHLYLLHGTLRKRSITKTLHLAAIFCVEALFLEAALTISAKLLLGDYMYYYFPSDLWHVTSFQNLPFYFVCGFTIIKTMQHFKTDPLFYSQMAAALLFVLVFLT